MPFSPLQGLKLLCWKSTLCSGPKLSARAPVSVFFSSPDQLNSFSAWRAQGDKTSFSFSLPISNPCCSLGAPWDSTLVLPSRRNSSSSKRCPMWICSQHISAVQLLNVNTRISCIIQPAPLQEQQPSRERQSIKPKTGTASAICIQSQTHAGQSLQTAPISSSFSCWEAECARSCLTVLVLRGGG